MLTSRSKKLVTSETLGVMKLVVKLLFFVATICSVHADAGDTKAVEPAAFVKVMPGRHWHLVGEWTWPDTDDAFSLYTISILQLPDGFVLVLDSTLQGGWGFWPIAQRLTESSNSTLVSAYDQTQYTIQPDSSLTIKRADADLTVLRLVRPKESFSSLWK